MRALTPRFTAAALLALASAAPVPAGPQGTVPSGNGDTVRRAPDGRRGLGEGTRLNDLLGVFRNPGREDEELLAHVQDLPRRVRVFEELAASSCRARDYYDLVPDEPDASLARLAEVFRDVSRAPEAVAMAGGPRARAFAGLHLDARMRVRMELLRDWEVEAAQIRRGLDLFHSAAQGYGVLSPLEASVAARRVDLAACLLRALELDLVALRELPIERGAPPVADIDQWLAAARAPYAAARQAAIEESRAAELRRVLALERALELPELRSQVEALLSWRAAATEAAAEALARAVVLLPETDEGKAAPPEIQRMRVTHRRQQAWQLCLEGLAFDPLNADLTYAAALAAKVSPGFTDAVSYYDRFLVLRGIRYGDDRTRRGRVLDEREEEALWWVDQHAKGAPPPPQPPAGADE